MPRLMHNLGAPRLILIPGFWPGAGKRRFWGSRWPRPTRLGTIYVIHDLKQSRFPPLCMQAQAKGSGPGRVLMVTERQSATVMVHGSGAVTHIYSKISKLHVYVQANSQVRSYAITFTDARTCIGMFMKLWAQKTQISHRYQSCFAWADTDEVKRPWISWSFRWRIPTK